jgi:hypothetical protein
MEASHEHLGYIKKEELEGEGLPISSSAEANLIAK